MEPAIPAGLARPPTTAGALSRCDRGCSPELGSTASQHCIDLAGAIVSLGRGVAHLELDIELSRAGPYFALIDYRVVPQIFPHPLISC